MRNHFNVIYFIASISLLSGCYPCGFLNWNCDQISKTLWYKNSEKCRARQQEIARNKIKYTEEIDMDIYHKCLNDPDYKFELDTNYSSN
ncbi:hypothetical protein [Rodentibacter haemolyticus]|uniref:Uncharacterized protein n=1 Tax=Rodentibacter haemolyticus TaxID=2778911 RepID=A0ABX6V0U3_9PAST|nr:hypothetical protein [Rodentibacter haemolyticus]QPB43233.1 hypothetical protein IHV77_03765 [Rodentibacter haemolyticus]